MRCAPKAASAKGHGLFRGNGEAIQPHADPRGTPADRRQASVERRPRSSWTLPRGSRTGHARPLTTLQTLEESVRLQRGLTRSRTSASRAFTRSRTSATTRSSWASPSRDRSPRSALQSWSQTQAPGTPMRTAIGRRRLSTAERQLQGSAQQRPAEATRRSADRAVSMDSETKSVQDLLPKTEGKS